jgi:DNA-binding winged helix-turn-helix (wHTH) protein
MLDQQGPIYRAGRWEIDPLRRELRANGTPVPLGSRAFDIVEMLIRSSGALVTEDDIMRGVWPGGVVQENTLHVHMSAVRKALGPDRKMLYTVSGRGYRLLGDWTATPADDTEPDRPSAPHAALRPSRGNLPISISDLIVRAAALAHIADLVSAHRVVTLVGPGGIGKTRLALEVAHRLAPHFPNGAWLIELASVSDPALVATTVAMAIGLDLGMSDVSSARVAQAIAARPLLVMLDNCEHLIEEVARLVEMIVRAGPAPCVLATSRESLDINGEHAYRVPALDVPPEQCSEPSGMLEYGAVQLFVARMQAAEHSTASRRNCRTSRTSPRSVANWTAFRWRSSWRRRARHRSGYPRSPVTSPTASVC